MVKPLETVPGFKVVSPSIIQQEVVDLGRSQSIQEMGVQPETPNAPPQVDIEEQIKETAKAVAQAPSETQIVSDEEKEKASASSVETSAELGVQSQEGPSADVIQIDIPSVLGSLADGLDVDEMSEDDTVVEQAAHTSLLQRIQSGEARDVQGPQMSPEMRKQFQSGDYDGVRAEVLLRNQGAIRSMPITQTLQERLSEAVGAVFGEGYKVEVYSGGQHDKASGKKRTGSVRHDHGKAADVYVVGPNGKRVTGDALAPLGQYWAAKRYGGVGMEMRGGGIHLDEHATPPKGGSMHWNYASQGGQYTSAQRKAMQLGLQGQLPELVGGRVVQKTQKPLGDTEAYIREAAAARGIDPEIAVKVAKSEGLQPGVWQSTVTRRGVREPSYGPFQLLVGGGTTGFPAGLGNDFEKKYGKSPKDESTLKEQIDFALDHAKKSGWGAWYGAAKVGVKRWDGISR